MQKNEKGELHLPFGHRKDVYERYFERSKAGDRRCPMVSKWLFYKIWTERCSFLKVRAFHRWCSSSFGQHQHFWFFWPFDMTYILFLLFLVGLLCVQLVSKSRKIGTKQEMMAPESFGDKLGRHIINNDVGSIFSTFLLPKTFCEYGSAYHF